MRIVVNTRLLLKNKLEGIGWFTYETLKRMVKNRPNDEFIFVFDRPFDKQFIFEENVVPFQIGPPARHPILWWIWFENSLPRVLNRFQPDVFLSPDGYLSLTTHIPSIPVIHDINFEHNPQDLPWAYRIYYRHYFKRFAERAARIATVSEYSKNDMVKTYQLNPTKIDVVYNGVNTDYTPLSESEIEATRQEIAEGKPYFLFIGSMHPRKNLINQLKAFARFQEVYPKKAKFVLVGEAMWKEDAELKKFSTLEDDVILLGRQKPERLKSIIGAAHVLSYVSHFEGFGIPILEGFSTSVPVVTSTTSAMPEVAGKGALLVNPKNPTAIFKAYEEAFFEENTRKKLIENGKKRLALFSWEQTASKLWNSIEKVVHA